MTSAMEEELARLRSRYDAQPDGRAFAPLADCYRKLSRLDEALDICLEGLQKHPKYSTAHVILGKIHRDREEPEAALRAFEHVVAIDEMNLLARRECATLAEELGDLRKAYEHWNRLLAADPEGDEAEAAIERLAESPELAVPVQSNALQRPDSMADAPEESEPAAALEAQLEHVEPEEPAPAAEPVAAAPSDAEREREIATITLARIYYDQGFKAKALDVYERVLSEHPENAELARRVQTIRAELEQLESRAADRVADGEDILDEAKAAGPSGSRSQATDAPPNDADLGREVDALTASIEAVDPRSEDYSKFRNWLSRVQEDDED